MLICAACGLTEEQEPSVRLRCCRVACNDCHNHSAPSRDRSDLARDYRVRVAEIRARQLDRVRALHGQGAASEEDVEAALLLSLEANYLAEVASAPGEK